MKNAKATLSALFWTVLLAAWPVLARGQAAAPPDFAIKSVKVEPAWIYVNSDAVIYVEVENVGRERVDNVQIVVNFSKLFAGVTTTTSLRPGETVVLTSAKQRPAPGSYEVKATLSLGGSAYGIEGNKANNEKTLTFQVQAGRAPGTNADLALADVKVAGTAGAYEVEAAVQNLGADPASCPFSVYLVTEVTKGARQVMKREDVVIPAGQSFAPGAVMRVGPFPIVDKDKPGPLGDGTYTVTLGVYNTAGTYLEEVDRQNNYYRGSFAVGAGGSAPPPDLSVKSIRVEPADVYANSDAQIRVEIENVGKERVDGVQIVVNFSKLFDGKSETVSLGPGETFVLTSGRYHPAPGKYEVKANLTLGGSAYGLEVSKANNERTLAIEVRAGRAPGTNADLALTDVKVAGAGNAYRVEATVRNIGTDPASCPFSVSLVTEVTKGTRQVMKREDVVIPAREEFAAGAAKKVGPFAVVDKDHPGGLEEGAYDVVIGVYNTAGTYVEEIDRQNNYYAGGFTVGSKIVGKPVILEVKTPKAAVGLPRSDYLTASPLEVLAGEEAVLKWSFPEAAEAALILDGRIIPLQVPAGEMKVKPACDMGKGASCTSNLLVVGRTRSGAKFEREVRVKVRKS